jgi:hypothetical protein
LLFHNTSNATKDLDQHSEWTPISVGRISISPAKISNFSLRSTRKPFGNWAPHELRVYDLINRVALLYSTWADIKRESLRSVTLSITSLLDDALPSIDDLVKDLLDQDVEMKRQDKQINLHRMPDRIPDRNHHTSLNPKSTIKCGYCDKTGHTENRCFKKHGYPDDKNGKAKGKGKTSEINRSVTLVLRKLPYAPANQAGQGASEQSIGVVLASLRSLL